MASVSVQSKNACPTFPFAALSATSGVGSLNRLLWKGYLYDKDLGCYCLGKRHYDPFALRFWEPDGLDFLDPSVPGGVNPYIYCLNDPITYTDPTGNSATAIVIGFIVGALIGIGAAGYIDYQNDGMLFNGDVQWYDYLGAGVVGGALGAGLGYLSTLSWSANIPTIGFLNQGGSLSVGLTHVAANISGAAIAGSLGGIGLLGGSIMFAKGFGPRMGHNQYENKQIDDLCRKHKLTMKERELLHRYISHQNYSYREIEEIIWEMFGK